MTITEQTTRQIFAGDGTANPLPIQIPFFDSTDLVVEKEVSGVTTSLVEGVDFTVSGGDGGGGTITPLAVIPSGTNWVVVRSLPLTQETDLENQDTLLPSAIEGALDRLVMMLLDTDDSSTRSIKADDGEVNPTGLRMPDLATRASKILQWDALGDITAVDPVDVDLDIIPFSAFGTAWVNLANALTGRSNLRVFYGLNAAKAASPTAGDLYFTTDTLEVYICKVGGAWLLMSSSQETVVKPNLIINGTAQVNQRKTCNLTSTYPNDDWGFCLDHVLLISDGDNAATVIQNTAEAPAGASHCFELVTATAGKKYGLFFPLSASQSASLLSPDDDRVCSVRFKHKSTAGVENLRAQVMSWQGAVDAMTDPFNDAAWGAEGALPTITGDWTYEGGGSEFLTGTDWATKEITNIAINTASTNNVGLFIWVDDLDLVITTDKIYIADVHINEGDALAPYSRATFREEFDACQRYYQKSFDYDVEPGTQKGVNGALTLLCNDSVNDDKFGANVRYPVPMHAAPTVTFYNPEADNAQWRNWIDDEDDGVSTVYNAGQSGFFVRAGAATLGVGKLIAIQYDAVAEITA